MRFLSQFFGGREGEIQNYADFWSWFQKKEKAFFKAVQQHTKIEEDFFDHLSPKLDQLQEGFFFLTGMYDERTVELVLTPDGNIKNIIFVEELIAAAPAIPGWKFTALKPAVDIEGLSISMSGHEFDKEKLFFFSNEHAEYPDEIDITLVHQDYTAENEKTITNGSYIFLDNFLGELDFVTKIDSIDVQGPTGDHPTLVPIGKLKDFLRWRQKEFIEKYEGTRYDTENDEYTLFEAELESGNVLVASMNTDLLSWDKKASHPWILYFELPYDGQSRNGMPEEPMQELLTKIEDTAMEELKDREGYLNIGRQTGENTRKLYFACKDFRKPSLVAHALQQQFGGQIAVEFDIYKDKYWQSFNRFKKSY